VGQNGTVCKACYLPTLRIVALKTCTVHERDERHQLVKELVSATQQQQGNSGNSARERGSGMRVSCNPFHPLLTHRLLFSDFLSILFSFASVPSTPVPPRIFFPSWARVSWKVASRWR
jgi:hypothetical protein